MSAIGGQGEKGKLITIQVEQPDTIDGVLDKIREIILKGNIQSISIVTGQPITYSRMVSEDEEVPVETGTQSFAGLTLTEIIRNIHMEEFDLKEQRIEGAPAQSIFLWMYLYMELEGWVPTHLLVAEESNFWSWMGVGRRSGRTLDKFMGLTVERDKTTPADVFLICGSNHRGAVATEIGYVLKGCAEAPHA